MDANYALLVGTLSPEKNESSYKYLKHRLGGFANWLTQTNRRWDEPALFVYRDYLLNERKLAHSTVNSHLSSIRGYYHILFENGSIQKAFEELQPNDWPPDQVNAAVEDAIRRLRSEVFVGGVHLVERRTETKPFRLTARHIIQLFGGPRRTYLAGRRNDALMVLMFTTGLREHEICALEVKDLYYTLDDYSPALHVPSGRGCTERLIPYGRLKWGLWPVENWLHEAKITEGPVFRSIYKGGKEIRPTRLSPRALENILASRPLEIDYKEVIVRPMDLRRAYARLLYEGGIELEDIKANLGLIDDHALLEYIGGKEASLDLLPGADIWNPDLWLGEFIGP